MSAEQNKAICRRVIEEAWNKGNLAAVDEVCARGYVDHDPANPQEVRGPDGVKQLVTMYRTAFPDTQLTIQEMIAEGDRVVTRWMAQGTHKGDLRGIAPTGKQVTVTGITMSRLADGKIVEEWANWDTLGLMQQLGAVPAAQAGS